MDEDKKERKTLYITHSGELLVWLIVLLIFVSIGVFIYISNEKNNNDYHIYMPDVDGLIVGSPVRMMGIEVGHITKIKPTNEEVFVKFLITDKNITIPQGTTATVEFSGMAGSKSLELYLPNKNTYIENSTPILSVNPPKRLHDAMGMLNEMFDKISSIIYTSSSFAEKVKFMEIPRGNNEDINGFIQYSNTIINDSNQKVEELNYKVNKLKGDREDGRKK